MTQVRNGKPDANIDDQIITDVIELPGVANFPGSGGGGLAVARVSRRGGYPTTTSASEAFWLSSATIATTYPLADALQLGNTRWSPRSQVLAREYTNQAIQVPIGYDPALTDAGLVNLPIAYQATLDCVMGKRSAGAGGMAIGFENFATSNMFTLPQGGMGFVLDAPTGQPNFTRISLRGDAALAGAMAPAIPIANPVSALVPRFVRWRVTWGRTWIAECFIDDVLQATVTPASFGYANLNQVTATQQFFCCPKIYGGNGLLGPFYSRATLRLIPY